MKGRIGTATTIRSWRDAGVSMSRSRADRRREHQQRRIDRANARLDALAAARPRDMRPRLRKP